MTHGFMNGILARYVHFPIFLAVSNANIGLLGSENLLMLVNMESGDQGTTVFLFLPIQPTMGMPAAAFLPEDVPLDDESIDDNHQRYGTVATMIPSRTNIVVDMFVVDNIEKMIPNGSSSTSNTVEVVVVVVVIVVIVSSFSNIFLVISVPTEEVMKCENEIMISFFD